MSPRRVPGDAILSQLCGEIAGKIVLYRGPDLIPRFWRLVRYKSFCSLVSMIGQEEEVDFVLKLLLISCNF